MKKLRQPRRPDARSAIGASGHLAPKAPTWQTVGELGEQALIQRLIRGGASRADVRVGPGDDCAVVRLAGDTRYDYLLKSDPVVEGVHFRRGTPGAAVGHKALARVLSDIAAMGGEGLWALVDFVAPASTPVAQIMAIQAGLNKLARRWSLGIVGGAVTSGPSLAVHVFGVGRVPRGQAVLRSGARAGDYLFVTGELGGSWRGKHLAFQPRLQESQWLRSRQWATAMIDLSDGLATDLRHLIGSSGVGAELWLKAIPVSAHVGKSAAGLTALRSHAKRLASAGQALKFPPRRIRQVRSAESEAHTSGQALEQALTDGEDYELLFTVPAAKAAALRRAWKKAFTVSCTAIGRITQRRGIIEGVDERGRLTRLKAEGYEHFR